MQARSAWATSLLVVFIAGTSAAGAADSRDTTKSSPSPPAPQHAMPDRDRQAGGMQGSRMMGGMQGGGMQRGGMMGGMQGGGMMGGMGGMMDMVNGCSQMMSGGAMPHLPPGNEKLQLKMQAEIMQKTGEILSRYADQIGDGK